MIDLTEIAFFDDEVNISFKTDTYRCLFIANEMLKIKDREKVEDLVQDVLQTLVENFNLNETELEYVVETSIHNLDFEGVE